MLMQREPKDAELLNLDRCYAAADRQRALSRRTQALLAAAGMDAPARRWFVATVAGGVDREAGELLKRNHVEVWLPVVKVMPPRRGRMRKAAREPVEKLAMRGYLFVKVEGTVEAWAGVATVKGVTGLLGCNGRPMPVADATVELLQRYFACEADAVAKVTNALKRGDQVEVIDGPLRELRGVVCDVRPQRQQASIMLLLFGRETPGIFDLAQIRKL